MTSLAYPVYDGKESVIKYQQRLEEFKLNSVRGKYVIVLEFINEILNGVNQDDEKKDENNKQVKAYKYKIQNIKSLKDFKKIKEDDLCKNHAYNVSTVEKFKKKFKETLNINVKTTDPKDSEEDPEGDLEHSLFIVSVIRRVLRTVNYKLVATKFRSGMYYSIKF